MFYNYPAMANISSNMNRQEKNVVAYHKVEEVLVAVREGRIFSTSSKRELDIMVGVIVAILQVSRLLLGLVATT